NREIQRGPTARHRDVSGPHSVAQHDRVGIAAAVLDEIRSRAMPEEVGVVSRAAQKNIVATQTVETILDVRSGEDIAAGCAVDIEPALQQPAVCQAAPVRELELLDRPGIERVRGIEAVDMDLVAAGPDAYEQRSQSKRERLLRYPGPERKDV